MRLKTERSKFNLRWAFTEPDPTGDGKSESLKASSGKASSGEASIAGRPLLLNRLEGGLRHRVVQKEVDHRITQAVSIERNIANLEANGHRGARLPHKSTPHKGRVCGRCRARCRETHACAILARWDAICVRDAVWLAKIEIASVSPGTMLSSLLLLMWNPGQDGARHRPSSALIKLPMSNASIRSPGDGRRFTK